MRRSGPWKAIRTDPLFFLLHCNVDRLWAKWQRQRGRFNPALAASYENGGGNPIGHNLPDTMWPWNGVTGAPRPPTAPGGAMAAGDSVTQSRMRFSVHTAVTASHRMRRLCCRIRIRTTADTKSS